MQYNLRKNTTISKAEIGEEQSYPYADEGIKAGFPSPAQDYLDNSIDLNKEIVKNPATTFFGRVSGNSLIDIGLNDGDIMVIDKSKEPQNGRLAVCFIDGEFTAKYIKIEKQLVWLMPANKEYKPIKVTADNDFIIWGMVIRIIKEPPVMKF